MNFLCFPIVAAGIGVCVTELWSPSVSRRRHYAWLTVGFALQSVGFAGWTVLDLTTGPSWHVYIDLPFALLNGWNTRRAYRRWRDSDDGRRRRRRVGARALLERLKARMPKPADPLPAPV